MEEVKQSTALLQNAHLFAEIISFQREEEKERKHLGVLVAGQEETLEEQAGQAAQLRPCAPRRHSKARRSGPTASGEACRPPNTGSSTNTRQLIT